MRNHPLGPENQVFSPRTKQLDNTSNFFIFCLCLNISFAISAYFSAPVSHQDLGRLGNPFAYLPKPVYVDDVNLIISNLRSDADWCYLLFLAIHLTE
jgi:hypothetical protein